MGGAGGMGGPTKLPPNLQAKMDAVSVFGLAFYRTVFWVEIPLLRIPRRYDKTMRKLI